MGLLPKDDILIEFVVQGRVVKATAINSATGIEASVIGPATARREVLTQAALRKLQYLLAKQAP